MGYKIIDFDGDTVQDGFYTATAAYMYMQDLYSKDFIKDIGLRVVREEKDERQNI